MRRNENRTPLEQPEGHVGMQVDWFDNEGELDSSQILSKNVTSSIYLSVDFPGNKYFVDEITEEDLFYSAPQLEIGWATNLSPRGLLEKIKEVIPDRPVKDYFCSPPVKKDQYFTKVPDKIIRSERDEVSIHLLEPQDVIHWQKDNDGTFISYLTGDSLNMIEEFIQDLMAQTVVPEKREAAIACLPQLKAFYSKYVEISFHD